MIDVLHFATIAAQRNDWQENTWWIMALLLGAGFVIGTVAVVIGHMFYEVDELTLAGLVIVIFLGAAALFMYNVESGESRENVAEHMEQNIVENFAIEGASIHDDDLKEFMTHNDDDRPIPLTVAFHHDTTKDTRHRMVYDESHDLMVPLHDEAERITPYIQEDSELDTLLAQR